MKRLAIAVCLLVAGCASAQQTEQGLTSACATYEQALFALASYRAAGKLTAGQISAVDASVKIVQPICGSTTPPTDLATALAQVQAGITALQQMQATVK